MAFVTAELYWLRMLLCDLRVPISSSPILWCDNLGAISLASNPVYHARTKHIEVDYHFIREKVVSKDIQIRFISTAAQLADIFTKGLTSSRFLLLRHKLLVRELPKCLKGDVKILFDTLDSKSAVDTSVSPSSSRCLSARGLLGITDNTSSIQMSDDDYHLDKSSSAIQRSPLTR
jgi:hypothetical protein